MDDFKTIKENAWSLPPGETRGKLIYVEETKWGKFWYYYDETDNTYWYQSQVVEDFDRQMKEREKERKVCSRRLRDGSRENSHQESA